MKYDKAIAYFEDAVRESDEIISDCSEALQTELTEQRWHFVTALSALRAQQERENPKPLTLEELKERVGRPVYMRSTMRNGWIFITNIINEPNYPIAFVDSRGFLSKSMYGLDNFYDHEPKEARDEPKATKEIPPPMTAEDVKKSGW
jgi:hypothetical protein